jgi:hypothetical protein
VIFDTETTGLVTNRCLRLDRQPHVWEFFGVDVDLDTGEHPPRASLGHCSAAGQDRRQGQEDHRHSGRGPRGQAADRQLPTTRPSRFLRFLSDGVIAHNLSFDMDMIEIEAERLGLAVSWVNPICSVEATMFMKGFRPR